MTKQTQDTAVVTDRFGQVDVAYYEREAMRLRNEYLRVQLHNLFSYVRKAVQNLLNATAAPRNA